MDQFDEGIRTECLRHSIIYDKIQQFEPSSSIDDVIIISLFRLMMLNISLIRCHPVLTQDKRFGS